MRQPYAAIPAPILPRRRPIAPYFVVGAGVAAALGSFLPWATVNAPFLGTFTVSGVDGSDGWVTAVLGLCLIGYGSLGMRGRRIHAVAAIGATLVAFGVTALGAWKVVELWRNGSQLRADLRSSSGDDSLGLGQAMSEAVQVHVGIGLWLITFGGLAGIIAVGLMRTSAHR